MRLILVKNFIPYLPEGWFVLITNLTTKTFTKLKEKKLFLILLLPAHTRLAKNPATLRNFGFHHRHCFEKLIGSA